MVAFIFAWLHITKGVANFFSNALALILAWLNFNIKYRHQKHYTLAAVTLESHPVIRAAERGEQEGHFAPGPRGLKGLIIGEFDIWTEGNALKCILSQSKGGDRIIFCSPRSQGA